MRQDGLEPSRLDQLGERAIAERIGEGGIGIDQPPAGQHGDGGRHGLEQQLHAVRGEGERVERGRFLFGHRGRTGGGQRQHPAFERTGDMLERLAVAVQLLEASLLSEVGHLAGPLLKTGKSSFRRRAVAP